MKSIAEENLNKIYDKIRHNALPNLKCNQLTIDPLPSTGDMRWGLSIVLRGVLPDSVFKKIKEVKTLIGNKHTYYNSDSIHFTIRSLEPYRENIQPNDQRLQLYNETLKNYKNTNFTIALKGIISTTSGLLLCGYPDFDLAHVRAAIYDDLNVSGLTSYSPEANRDKLRNTCHASLIIYESEINNNSEYMNFLDKNSKFDFGVSVNLDLQIVKYERKLNQVKVLKIS